MTKYNRVQYKSPIQNSAWENKNLKCSLKQVGMDRGLWELWVPVENTRESIIAYVKQVPFQHWGYNAAGYRKEKMRI